MNRRREKQCRRGFSVKTGTVMHGANLGDQTRAPAIHLALIMSTARPRHSMNLYRTEASPYPGWKSGGYKHDTVQHGVGEPLRGKARLQ